MLMCWNKRNDIITLLIFFIRFYDRPWWQNYTLTQICCLANMSVRSIWALQCSSWLTFLFILCALGKKVYQFTFFFCQCLNIIFCISLFRFLVCFFLHSLDLYGWSAHWEAVFVGHPNQLPLWGSRGPVLTISVTQRCKGQQGQHVPTSISLNYKISRGFKKKKKEHTSAGKA